jgi:CHAD domain-containing protein
VAAAASAWRAGGGWEPGANGLSPPPEVAGLIDGVLAGKELVPLPPLSADRGAVRLREMLGAQLRQLLSHDPGTRLGADPENLHQHRVAARRTRAFLRAPRAHVDSGWRRSLTERLQELGEATGPMRDLDVLLDHVREQVRGLDESERAGAEALLAKLEERRGAARGALLEALARDSYRSLLWRLRLPPRLADGVEAVPLEQIASREFRRLAKAVRQLGKDPDDAALHALRIKLKRARYAAELASPDGQTSQRFLSRAKTLQTLLGEHQDAAVAERRLQETAVHDAETAAAFVAGRLAERQRVRRAEIRERLPSAWKRLRKSGAQLR